MNIIKDELLVPLDDYRVLDSKNPIGYTRDIHSCIVALVHKTKCSVLLHIEANDRNINIDYFLEALKREEGNKIKSVDLFIGDDTNIGNLSIVQFILHRFNIPYNEYKVFRNNSNETSVGFNYITKDYYMATMDKGMPILTKKMI